MRAFVVSSKAGCNDRQLAAQGPGSGLAVSGLSMRWHVIMRMQNKDPAEILGYTKYFLIS